MYSAVRPLPALPVFETLIVYVTPFPERTPLLMSALMGTRSPCSAEKNCQISCSVDSGTCSLEKLPIRRCREFA